jgi:DNA polymerase-3 subunit alpha
VIKFSGHLHVHDEYSPLDGCGNRNQISYAAAHAGQTHLGFTNHGRLGGALEHVHACRHPEKYDNPFDESQKRSADERLTPILGIEAFFRPDRFMDLTDQSKYGKNGHNWAHHLCVHAASLRGWRTLMRLSSKSWVKRDRGGGHYGKPCFDFAMLEEDNEDIIISTACLASPLSWYILNGDEKGAKRFLRKLDRIANGRVWLEIMPHNLDEQRELNIGLANLAYETSRPLIATGDVHIPFADWQLTHQVTRMASFKQSFKSQNKKKEEGEDVYTDEIDTVFLSSGEEMLEQFRQYHPDLPEDIVHEAMANTHDFTRQVRWYAIDRDTKKPRVDADAEKVVKEWCDEGWDRLSSTYPTSHWDKWSKKTYRERYLYEFSVLKEKGVLDYFYIVGDFVRWAKSELPLPARKRTGEIYYPKGKHKRPIRVGLGRGSAAGSLVSYLVGITSIDPIPHKLLFERFLNPDRVGYPDIDIDFETGNTVLVTDDGRTLDGRECVKEYLRITYGHDHVVDIIAYQTFAPRVLTREVGRVFDLPYEYVEKVTESIGDIERGIAKLAHENEALADLRDSHPEIWDVMLNMEDQILRDTRHAGGVVITPEPTTYYMPTQLGADEETTVTAWADRADFPVMSDYGFLKYDILGVKSLTRQQLAVDLIGEYYEERFEPNELPALRDPLAVERRVIDGFVHGLTIGVFQFSGRGITQLLRHIKPDNATDVSVANALYRPGPIAIAFEYGDRKNGKVPITYWHDSLEPILGETLGLMCFQEQAMEVSKQIGNFTGGQADALRKAMSKLYRLPGDKAQEFMSQFKEQWHLGCAQNGLREEDAEHIWTDRMLPLGNYLFNRSHSSSYGLQAIQDMHIKIFYPLASYASMLTVDKKQKKEDQQAFMRAVLREARIFDIEAALPHINRSRRGWTIDSGKLRYGLMSINGIAGGNIAHILNNRPFEDYRHFATTVPSGFGADKMVGLVKAGAFDETDDREYLLARTRQWNDGIAKLKIKMTCGCLKSRTVKADIDELEEAIEQSLSEIACKNHPDAEIETAKRIDDTYEVARFIKEHPGDEPIVVTEPPSDIQLNEMELDALNISLSQGKRLLTYKPFIDERIYTEEEIEALPDKPPRRRSLHGTFCSCHECRASQAVVGGEITGVKVIRTKKGEPMAFVDVAYGINQYSCTLFPEMYERYKDLLDLPTAFLIAGTKDKRGSINVQEMDTVESVAKEAGWKPSNKVVSMEKFKVKKALRKRKQAMASAS